jgi:serine/threonine-protein kinase
LDFGIARLSERPEGLTVATEVGSLMGTPAFIAPEQARGRWQRVDARTDLWALGATLFTLLTGRFVYHADTINEQLGLAMTTPAPSLARFGAYPPALVACVGKALAFSQEQRYQTAGEMRAGMNAALESLAGDPEPPDVAFDAPEMSLSTLGHGSVRPAPKSEPPRFGVWRWLVPVGFLAALALAGQIWFARTPPLGPETSPREGLSPARGERGSPTLETKSPSSTERTGDGEDTTPHDDSEQPATTAKPELESTELGTASPPRAAPQDDASKPAPPKPIPKRRSTAQAAARGPTAARDKGAASTSEKTSKPPNGQAEKPTAAENPKSTPPTVDPLDLRH